MDYSKLTAWAIAFAICSVAVVGAGYSAINSTYTNDDNTSTVTQSTHTVGIWSGTSGNYSLVSNGGLVNNITYELSSHTTGSGTTYSAESQVYTLVDNKYVFIDGSATQTTYTPGNVLLKVSGFDPDYIDGDSITVRLNSTAMAGEVFTVGDDMSWIGVLTLGSTADSCRLNITIGTEEKVSYTYDGFGSMSISVKMLSSSDGSFYSTSLTKTANFTVPSDTNGDFIAGAAYVPSAASSKVTVTLGSALPETAQVYIGGVLATTTDHKVFDCTALNGGSLKIVFASATVSDATYTVSVSSS